MPSAVDDIELQLRNVIDNLYRLMIQNFDYQGPESSNAIVNEITRLISNLAGLTTSSRTLPVAIPRDLIEYTEAGRNPNIYNREFVEKVQSENQELKGRAEAFANFGDAFAKEIIREMPELKEEVKKVIGRDTEYINGVSEPP